MAGAAALSIDEASTAEVPGTVPSPMVGTIYMASGPGEAPFVKTGDQVSEGQTLLIVEAMKVMNPILAPRAGTVSAIFVEDGHPVEFGEALLAIT
jgi:acetyl-CoA carboxylase biotin carboxyl carrier protein